jgi:hypothetical protein
LGRILFLSSLILLFMDEPMPPPPACSQTSESPQAVVMISDCFNA